MYAGKHEVTKKGFLKIIIIINSVISLGGRQSEVPIKTVITLTIGSCIASDSKAFSQDLFMVC